MKKLMYVFLGVLLTHAAFALVDAVDTVEAPCGARFELSNPAISSDACHTCLNARQEPCRELDSKSTELANKWRSLIHKGVTGPKLNAARAELDKATKAYNDCSKTGGRKALEECYGDKDWIKNELSHDLWYQ